MRKIDAHIHFGDDDPGLLALLDEFDLKLLNICFAEEMGSGWREDARVYCALAQSRPERFGWCTSFDLPRFDDPHYLQEVIVGLDRDFDAGAVACKVWKNLGMELKQPDGSFMMVDDPRLAPVFEHIAERGKTLLMHIGEPLACWQPLNPDNPHYGYYAANPQWHMAGKADFPSHQTLIAARDHVVARHPNLRVVGAHLGSLEHDVDEVAARLDRYPNFAVDTSARLVDLAVQDTDKVRRFLLDYQDRVLFGTDVVMHDRPSHATPEAGRAVLDALRATYRMHFDYFERDDLVAVHERSTRGLNLPPPVLARLYADNALAWYPGL